MDNGKNTVIAIIYKAVKCANLIIFFLFRFSTSLTGNVIRLIMSYSFTTIDYGELDTHLNPRRSYVSIFSSYIAIEE